MGTFVLSRKHCGIFMVHLPVLDFETTAGTFTPEACVLIRKKICENIIDISPSNAGIKMLPDNYSRECSFNV